METTNPLEKLEKRKAARREANRRYYEKQKASGILPPSRRPEARTEHNRRYYELHREMLRASHSNWQKNNPEKVREYNRRYRNKRKLERAATEP